MGHLSKDCKRKMTCEKCQKRHPTLLHIVGVENSNVEPQLKITVAETKEKEPSVTSALVTTGDAIGAGKDCALAIVPVRVKVAKVDSSQPLHYLIPAAQRRSARRTQ